MNNPRQLKPLLGNVYLPRVPGGETHPPLDQQTADSWPGDNLYGPMRDRDATGGSPRKTKQRD